LVLHSDTGDRPIDFRRIRVSSGQVNLDKDESQSSFRSIAGRLIGGSNRVCNVAAVIEKGGMRISESSGEFPLPTEEELKDLCYVSIVVEFGFPEFDRLAAAQGDSEAQFRYETALQSGDGISVDWSAAARFFKLAADQNHGEAKIRYEKCLLECHRAEIEVRQLAREVSENQSQFDTEWFNIEKLIAESGAFLSDQSGEASPHGLRKKIEKLGFSKSGITDSVIDPLIKLMDNVWSLCETQKKVIREHGRGTEIVEPRNREIIDDLRSDIAQLRDVIEERIGELTARHRKLLKKPSIPGSGKRCYTGHCRSSGKSTAGGIVIQLLLRTQYFTNCLSQASGPIVPLFQKLHEDISNDKPFLDIDPLIELESDVVSDKSELTDCFSGLVRLFGSAIPDITSSTDVVFDVQRGSSVVQRFSVLAADMIATRGVLFFGTRSVVLRDIPEVLGDFLLYAVVSRVSKTNTRLSFQDSRGWLSIHGRDIEAVSCFRRDNISLLAEFSNFGEVTSQ
jgi:hypothetical protein